MATQPCPQCKGTVSTTVKKCPHCGHKLRSSSGGCLGIAVALVGAFLFLPTLFPGDPAVNEAYNKQREERDKALSTTKIHVQSWSKGGFETVMLLNARIENGAPVAIHDVQITCTLSGKSGTPLNTLTKVVYDEIPAKKHLAIKDFAMGTLHAQAASASCAVTMLRV